MGLRIIIYDCQVAKKNNQATCLVIFVLGDRSAALIISMQGGINCGSS